MSMSNSRRDWVPAWVLVALLVISVAGAGLATADNSTATMEVIGPDEVSPGEEVTLTVRIDSADPVYGAEFGIGYDSDAIDDVDVTSGTYLSEDANTLTAVAGADQDAEVIEYAQTRAGVDTGVTGSGVLATVTFSVTDRASGSLSFPLETAELVDPDAERMAVDTVDLTIDIADETDNTGSTNNSEATGETDEPVATDAADWPASIDVSVQDRLNRDGTASVFVHTDDPEAVATSLEGAGASSVSVLENADVVGATVDDTTARKIGERTDVSLIELDTTAVSTEPTAVGVVDISVPDAATVGEEQTVTVTLTSGSEAVEGTVSLLVDDTVVSEREVVIVTNDSTTVSFEFLPEEPGTVSLAIDSSLTDSIVLGELTVTDTTDGDSETGSSSEADDSQSTSNQPGTNESVPGMGLIATLTGLLIFLAVARRRSTEA